MAIQWTRRGILKAGVAGAAIAGGAAAGVAAWPLFTSARKASKKNIICIVCDSLRADRIGRRKMFLGRLQSLTPNIDRIAANGVTFVNAKSPSTQTQISMLSIFYDIPPTQYDYVSASTTRAGGASIASALAARGYVTLFSCANMLLGAEPFTTGFDENVMLRVAESSAKKREEGRGGAPLPEIAGGVLNSETLSLVGRHAKQLETQPLYLQVHYMDTHHPYNHAGYPMDVPADERICPQYLNTLIKEGKTHLVKDGLTIEQAMSTLKEYYDCSTYACDRFLGALLAELDEYKVLDDCLIIITADHGEEFADNRESSPIHVGHMGPLNEEEISVPLIVASTGDNAYCSGGRKAAGIVASSTVINGLVRDYVSVAPGQYSEIRSAIEACAYPEHNIVMAINAPRVGETESGCIWRDEAGYIKHRIFYDDAWGVIGHKAFRYTAGGGIEEVPVSQEMKERALKTVGDYRPHKQWLDGETEKKMRALGYLN
jgi:membrane-anchored protein YejM (alkaline phosphatase superfamily)